jgi:hypothetical protein
MRFLDWEWGVGGFVWKYVMRGVLGRLGVGRAWARRCSDGDEMVMAEPPFVVEGMISNIYRTVNWNWNRAVLCFSMGD